MSTGAPRGALRLTDVPWRPPVITTNRLVLRGYEPSDAEAIFHYASDPEVTPYMAWDRIVAIDGALNFLDGVVAPHDRDRELDYAITLKGRSAIVIGGLGLCWEAREHRVMCLGYVLAKEHWGRAIVPEAARELIEHAFATTDVCRIFAPIFADNAKSRRAADKIGLSFEGVLRSAVEYRGVRRDEAIYAVVRGDAR